MKVAAIAVLQLLESISRFTNAATLPVEHLSLRDETPQTKERFDETTKKYKEEGLCRTYDKGPEITTCEVKCGNLIKDGPGPEKPGSPGCIKDPSIGPDLTDPDGNKYSQGKCSCNVPHEEQVIDNTPLNLPVVDDIGCQYMYQAFDSILSQGPQAILQYEQSMDIGMSASIEAAQTIAHSGKQADSFLGWLDQPCNVGNYTKDVEKIFNPLCDAKGPLRESGPNTGDNGIQKIRRGIGKAASSIAKGISKSIGSQDASSESDNAAAEEEAADKAASDKAATEKALAEKKATTNPEAGEDSKDSLAEEDTESSADDDDSAASSEDSLAEEDTESSEDDDDSAASSEDSLAEEDTETLEDDDTLATEEDTEADESDTGYDSGYSTSDSLERRAKKAKTAKSGKKSTGAGSGKKDTAASSGKKDTAASSGKKDTTADSGKKDTTATSGKKDETATSGKKDTAATSGKKDTTASSGKKDTTASSGKKDTTAGSGKKDTTASSKDDSTTGSESTSAAEEDSTTSLSKGAGAGAAKEDSTTTSEGDNAALGNSATDSKSAGASKEDSTTSLSKGAGAGTAKEDSTPTSEGDDAALDDSATDSESAGASEEETDSGSKGATNSQKASAKSIEITSSCPLKHKGGTKGTAKDKTLGKRAPPPEIAMSQAANFGRTWVGHAATEEVVSNNLLRRYARRGYEQIQDRFDGGNIIVAAFHVSGVGVVVASSARASNDEAFVVAERLKALAQTRLPAYWAIVRDRTHTSGLALAKWHAEDVAMVFGARFLACGGQTKMATYGRYRPNAELGPKPPCNGPGAQLQPPCRDVLNAMEVSIVPQQ
ncbi:MAG: hypothetical protein Q9178_006460 [Gyalolechia marmorata]